MPKTQWSQRRCVVSTHTLVSLSCILCDQNRSWKTPNGRSLTLNRVVISILFTLFFHSFIFILLLLFDWTVGVLRSFLFTFSRKKILLFRLSTYKRCVRKINIFFSYFRLNCICVIFIIFSAHFYDRTFIYSVNYFS